MDDTAFFTEVRGIFYCDLPNKATFSPKRMSKRELYTFAVEKAIIPEDASPSDYTCPVLRQKLHEWVEEHRVQVPHGDDGLAIERQAAPDSATAGKETRHKQSSAIRLRIVNSQIDRPKVLTSFADLPFTANNQAVYELCITSNGIIFEARARQIVDLPVNCIPHRLGFYENCLFVADSNIESGGILKLSLDKTAPQKLIANDKCGVAHGIAFIGDNVIFTDRKCNIK